MKFLIWLGCIIVASFTQIFLGYVGLTGAIPAMLVFGGMFASAKFFCKKYDEWQDRKYAPHPTKKDSTDTISIIKQQEDPVTDVTPLPRVSFCRKCGFKLLEDSAFCSKCGTAIVKE